MKYYHQSTFGGSDAPLEEQGDCWATAVALLLGVSSEKRDELHQLIMRAGDKWPNWFNVTVGWVLIETLGSLGLYTMDIVSPNQWEMPEDMYGDLLVAGGPSPRGDYGHAILWHKSNKLEWDPYPEGGGFAGPIEDISYLKKLT